MIAEILYAKKPLASFLKYWKIFLASLFSTSETAERWLCQTFHVLDLVALIIVVLSRKELHPLPQQFAIHEFKFCILSYILKRSVFILNLCFGTSNSISKPFVCILNYISAPQIGNELQNSKPYFFASAK